MLNILESISVEFWAVLAEMSPYLLFGFFFAGLLSILISPAAVERHLGGKGIVPVAKASLFGVPLPLCSCGVIPVAASLRKHGASRGATTAFLLSTPQTGVDSIFVTFSLLGLTVAVIRPVAAFLTGLLGGWLVSQWLKDEASPRANNSGTPAGAACPMPQTESKWRQFWEYGFVDLPRDIGRALVAGLLIAGVIAAAIPSDYFAGLRGTGLWPKIVMMAVGIPIYVCATGSVPIAAALVHQGVSPGAALVFLMTGPATNAATIAVILKTMGRGTVAIYLATVAVCSLASGILLDFALTTLPHHAADHGAHAMIPLWANNLCAVALIAILVNALFRPFARKTEAPVLAANSESVVRLQVEGMTCSHCVKTVQQALAASRGVRSAQVDLEGESATVVGENLDPAVLVWAVEQAGYSAKTVQ